MKKVSGQTTYDCEYPRELQIISRVNLPLPLAVRPLSLQADTHTATSWFLQVFPERGALGGEGQQNETRLPARNLSGALVVFRSPGVCRSDGRADEVRDGGSGRPGAPPGVRGGRGSPEAPLGRRQVSPQCDYS